MFVNLTSSVLRTCMSVRKMSSGKLCGKVAVITASTDGIGFAIAERMACEGAKVMISSRKQANVERALSQLQSVVDKNSVAGCVCHVSKSEDRINMLKKTCETFGGIDILVSNAAVNPAVGPTLECEESVWDKIFDTNVKSAFMIAKETLPYLKERKGGSIIFVSSIAAYNPLDPLGVYSVSKTALLGLTKAVAKDLALTNITCNCIAPGIVKTRFSEAITAVDATLDMIPMRRYGEPRDIAGVAAFLASDDARYITGETIVPAGGMVSRL